MISFRGGFRLLSRRNVSLHDPRFEGFEMKCTGPALSSTAANFSVLDRSAESFNGSSNSYMSASVRAFASVASSTTGVGIFLQSEITNSSHRYGMPALQMLCKNYFPGVASDFARRSMSAVAQPAPPDYSAPAADAVPARIKFKRLDKTAKHIMQILDKEAVSEVQAQREIPDIRPGYVIQLKMEVPENKRRVQVVKGIVIARRNAGLNTTFRLRRLVGGVGVESLFPLYSPNIREIKVLEKKKVRRAKLYYLRDKMNALKK
uniref:Ribosomal protein L19 n=1 Tax=Kalanchoe fedtschenkoi TaxID=63787 RepID=A0A7N0RCI8_KALFE